MSVSYKSALPSFAHPSKNAVSVLLKDPACSVLCTRRQNELPTTPRVSGCFLSYFGLVGEPINHDAWQWFYHVVGEGRCTLVDTWWQTGKRRPRAAWGALTLDRLLVGREALIDFNLIQQVCQKNPPDVF